MWDNSYPKRENVFNIGQTVSVTSVYTHSIIYSNGKLIQLLLTSQKRVALDLKLQRSSQDYASLIRRAAQQ